MKKIIIFLTIFCVMQANGQKISFVGSGLSSVKIENLTKAATVTLNAGEILTLSEPTAIFQIDGRETPGINIYPNPMTEESIFEVLPPSEGDAIVTIYEITGKPVTQINTYLQNSPQKFNISGLNKGVYLINIKAKTYQLSGKLICNVKSAGKTIINKVSSGMDAVDIKTSKMSFKGLQEDPSIQYSPGDVLKFTGVSGLNTTIVTAKTITQDTIITFNFITCTDVDGNNYPVVNIGTQVWMAENLKTTKYQNGDLIETTTPATLDITGETTPKYQWAYNGNEDNVIPMGRLYTYYAITDDRGICPAGWHMPSDQEWTILTTYLGGTGIAGGKLKETGTVHWTGTNIGATNETGFTAIPGGLRTFDGYFMYIARWWSSTEVNSGSAYGRTMNGYNDDVTRNSLDKKDGNAMRCLYGIDPLLISTEAKINDTLVWAYSKLKEYIEFSYLFDAIYSNHISTPNNTWIDIYQHTQTPSDLKILKLWSDAYNIIYKLNLVIKSADIVISDQLVRNSIVAQAKGIRGYLNHNLLTWFGEIPLEEGISESNIPRNTIDEVLALIKNDALFAAQYLPLSWSASEKFRIPQSFAKGLLARASLYTRNFIEALTPTQIIINSAIYMLSSGTDLENFTSMNTEIFWGFEKSDNTEFNTFFTKGTYVPAMRYTEAYLVAAEALYNLGNTGSAVSYINALRVRRDIPPEMALTINEIFQFWISEMAKEGNMFSTLKRFDNALSIVQGMPHKLVLPLPQAIINFNPYLTQNIGY